MNNDNNDDESQNSLNYQSSTKNLKQLRTNQDLNVDLDMSDNEHDGQIRFVEGLADLNQVQKLTSQTLLRGGTLA